jgi:hypothetical protein
MEDIAGVDAIAASEVLTSAVAGIRRERDFSD